MGPNRASIGICEISLTVVNSPSCDVVFNRPSSRRSDCQFTELTSWAKLIQPTNPENVGSSARLSRGR